MTEDAGELERLRALSGKHTAVVEASRDVLAWAERVIQMTLKLLADSGRELVEVDAAPIPRLRAALRALSEPNDTVELRARTTGPTVAAETSEPTVAELRAMIAAPGEVGVWTVEDGSVFTVSDICRALLRRKLAEEGEK